MKDERTEITFTGTVSIKLFHCFFLVFYYFLEHLWLTKMWENGTQSKWRIRNQKYFFAGFTSHRYVNHAFKYFRDGPLFSPLGGGGYRDF